MNEIAVIIIRRDIIKMRLEGTRNKQKKITFKALIYFRLYK